MPGPAPGARPVMAVDVGGTSIKATVARIHGPGQLLGALSRRPTPRGAEVIRAVTDLATDLLDHDPDVEALGLVVPGIVDGAAGIARSAVNLGLHDLDVVTPLREALGVPVLLDHDVTAAASAEVALGGTPSEDPLVVVIGTGIAATAFSGRVPLASSGGQPGELGHVVVRPGGRRCQCGRRGCLEAEASARAVAERYAELTGTRLPGALEVLALSDTDHHARAAWTSAIEALADGLLDACALLAPGVIIVGGGLSAAGDALLTPLRTALDQRRGSLPVPPVELASLGPDAGLHGAALRARAGWPERAA